jgi:hypothetical protein
VKAMTKQIARRNFLRGTAGALIALPFLGSLQRSAKAAGMPKRIVLWHTANGTIYENWKPTGTESNFTFGSILKPLAPFKAKVLVLDGVDNEVRKVSAGAAHQAGIGSLWSGVGVLPGDLFPGGGGKSCGWGGGITIDQHIANTVGQTTALPSLELGLHVQQSQIRTRMSYKDAELPVPPECDPTKAFDRVFGDLTAEPEALAQLRKERKSILDAVGSEYDSLNARLGSDDQKKLEAHLDAVREIEKGLDKNGGSIGGNCQLPDLGAVIKPTDETKMPQLGKKMMDILAMALTCDLTRVGSIIWGGATNNIVHSWLGHSTGHHPYSHGTDATSKAKLTEINNWFAQQFAYLIGKLDAVDEGDGTTVLDNTVVVWGNELGVGQTHSRTNIPFVMAGSCGGYFDTGRFIEYPGAWHNDLLVSLCNAMDAPVNKFGNTDFCKGELGQLTA